MQIDPAEVAALIEHAGTRGEALASDLLRAGLGFDSLGAPDNVVIDGVIAQLIATMLADPAPGPTLVISPVSVLGNWERELQRFAPHLTVMAHHGRDRHNGNELPFALRASQHTTWC